MPALSTFRLMPQEIEIRFRASEHDLIRIAKGSVLHGYSVGPAATKRLNTVYYDTPEHALAKTGLSLRVRKDGGDYVQTVKDESSGALISMRHEYECTLPTPEPDVTCIPDERIRERVRALADGAEIAPVIETDIRRTTRSVKSPAGDKVELAIDRGEIRTLVNGRAALAVNELELELKEGAPVVLFEIARRLSRKASLTVTTESKSARGMRMLEGQEICSHKAGRMELAPDCTAEEAVGATLLHCLRHLARNTEAIAVARLPEGVHQIRVGLRRLRAALSASGKEFRVRALENLRERAKTLADIFGVTRELDVFATELLAPVEDSTKEPGLAQVRLILEELRPDSWDRAVALVQSDDFTGFVLDLAVAIETRVWRESATAEQLSAFLRPARELAVEALDKRLKQACKRAKHLSSLNVQERHRLRIALKKLRYSAEFFAPLFPTKAVMVFQGRLSKLQDLFGALNDAAAAESILRRITEHAGERRSTELMESAAFIDGWHQSRIQPTWDKAKKRWKGFSKTEPFWRC
jgi:inorganic triphosphatase YgiF